MKKSLIVYPLIIGVFTFLIYLVIEKGNTLQHAPGSLEIGADKPDAIVVNSDASILEQFIHNIQSPLSLLLMQILIILLVSRVFGLLFKRLGQPEVVGEMLAGIALGPSLLGLFLPEAYDFIFPKDSFKSLQFLSQIGLAFFMFIIGMELDVDKIKSKAKDAIVISHASIIFPFFLGVLLSYFLFLEFSAGGVSFMGFAFFMGIAMSITAFPVLARIVQERGLTRTTLGSMVITCAAADDVTAWCLLACVIAVVKAGGIMSALFTIVLALVFVLVMLYAVKPALRNLGRKSEGANKMSVAMAFFVMLISAYISEVIGIHALFGAFLAGVIMPSRPRFKEVLASKIEDISVLLLLPIFFAFTGLRTQIALLNDSSLWLTCLIVILIAVAGKIGGSAVSARIMGQSWRESLIIGALMNTRGLMELVVLNIGYDLGILSAEIFAVMVLMALTTTFMTGPLLDLINWFWRDHKPPVTSH